LADDSWLELPKVSPGKKLTGERKRFPSMAKKLVGKSRIWACDGEFVAFRRAKSNPETLKRHEAFLKTGDYKHIETQDDVEIYQLQPSSPFKRKVQVNLGNLDDYNVRRAAALAACNRDWAMFVDSLSELAGRIKHSGRYHEGFANLKYNEDLESIFLAINMRGGPSRSEIDREVQALRRRRGDTTSRVILLPPNVVRVP
jgi:hypothetical protein